MHSGLRLCELRGELISPLHSMTKSAKFLDRDHSPSDDDFESLKPTLQLYLAHNSLRRLPRELWTLNNLSVLSLRNNKLTSLPPSIARLASLVELNVAGNRLRWLPWELLRLLAPNGSLRILTVCPNPFLKPFPTEAYSNIQVVSNPVVLPISKGGIEASLQGLEQMHAAAGQETAVEAVWCAKLHREYLKQMDDVIDFSKISAFHMASTPVAHYDLRGSVEAGVVPPSDLGGEIRVIRADIPSDESAGNRERISASRVPSLFEVAAKAALTVPSLPTLHTLLPDETPAAVLRALEKAVLLRTEEGPRCCSVCGRSYVLPRTEWIEFWHRIPVHPAVVTSLSAQNLDEIFLPFLRRGCSSGCVA
jgi:Leucine rich repeat